MGFFYGFTLIMKCWKYQLIGIKKNATITCGVLVGRAGFEPAKFTQQIYSLPSLAAWVSPQSLWVQQLVVVSGANIETVFVSAN